MSAAITETAALANDSRPSCGTNSGTSLNDAMDKVKVINNDAQINALADDKDREAIERAATKEGVVATNDSQSSSSSRSETVKGVGEQNSNNEMEIDTSESSVREHPASTARRASTTSRFKEKRPEPLKLNSNLNQDIPLDLSVKSAGNVPSGALGSIFNLGQLNQMGPLETPRIQWQDNDSLLASTKSRLFSSSTNASHRARISSIMGESPPITPSTPLMDVMFSSSAAASIHRLPSDPSYSAILALESPLHSFLTSPFDLDKLHILDRLSQPSKQDLYHHHYHHHQMRTDARGVPRRSSSTDSLNILTNSGRNQMIVAENVGRTRTKARYDNSQSPSCLGVHSKKNSISPLATKSFSNNSGSELNPPTKFPYTNQQIETNSESQHQHQSPTTNSNGKSLTPTSVAAVNLFNIQLSSPNGSSRQSPVDPMLGLNKSNSQQQYKSPSFPSLDQETCILDVPNSVLYCHQQQQHNARTPLLGFSSSSSGLDQNNNQLLGEHHHRQHSNPSISSTATLNTPTLISPSQMKANQLCLLPSPTLSPMPSVFDIPSPFLMFAPSSTQTTLQQHGSLSSSSIGGENRLNMSKQSASQNLRGDASQKTRCESKQVDKSSVHSRLEKHPVQLSRSLPSNSACVQGEGQIEPVTVQNGKQSLVKNDLSQLITPAEEKTAIRLGSKMDDDHEIDDLQQDIDMAIDDDNGQTISSATIPTKNYNFENSTRPSTVIPHIHISYHTHAKSLSNLRDDERESNKLANQTGAVSDSNCLSLVDCNQSAEEFDRQRNSLGKRSLSPKTFHARVRNYHNERLESSSAPPDVHQRRRRSKIKTAADSCLDVGDNKNDKDKVSKLMIGPGNKTPNLSQSASCLNQTHYNKASSRPYPEMRHRLTTSNHQFDGQPDIIGANLFLNGRSSSAEPAIFSDNHSNKTVPCTITNGNSINFSPSQSASHLCSGQNDSNLNEQSQQQGQHLRGPTNIQNLDGHRFQGANPPNQQQQQPQQQQQQQHHHHQQHYHSLANHQFHYNIHANNYDHNHSQHHQPYNAQQLYSMSASELQRLQHSRHGCPSQQPSSATSVIIDKTDSIVLPQRISNYHQQYNIQQQQNNHHQQHIQHQQHSSFPHGLQDLPILASGENINSQTGAHQRAPCQSQFLNHAPGSAQSQSLINQMGFQPTVAQVMCGKFETSNQLNHCQDMIVRRDTLGTSLSEEHPSILTCAKSPAGQQKGPINQYIVDIETRSESRSSSSLDFTNSFTGSNCSRPNSAASSNLAAKKYRCDQCSKSFTRSDMLTRHRRLHSGDRPFQCTECKQEFSRSDHLSTHMRTHTGEKPYKCKLCTYSACRKDMITRHLKVHNRSPNLDE